MRLNYRLDEFHAAQMIQDYEGRDCAPWLFLTVWGCVGLSTVLFWYWAWQILAG